MSAATTENVTVDLDQLLARLEKTLLSPTADDSALRATPYERSRIGAVGNSLTHPYNCLL